MDKNVHPVAAFLVVVISVLTIGVWLWASGEAKEYGGPAGLTVDPDGNLYIQVRHFLLEHDPDGSFVARHDLSALDVDILLGGTDFFANGDILLRRGPDTRSIGDTIRAYQRKTNQSSLVPDAPDTGLFRCSLDTVVCSTFGAEPIDFKATFSVFIDRSTDDVYISDSSRHLIRKYSADGIELSGPAGGFKFPNQLMLHEGTLLVADTNHHRIVSLDPSADDFGSELDSHLVVPTLAVGNDQRWPSHFTRVGDEWWVNNMMTGMNFGGIYVFDDRWQFQRMIVLPGDPDPISLIAFNDEILISDWYADTVHRVSPSGEVLGQFTSTGLAELREESDAARALYMLYAWLGVALGLFFAALLVIKGTDWAQRKAPPDDRPPSDDGEPIVLEPDPDNVKKLLANSRLARLILLPIAIGMPVLMFMVDDAKLQLNLLVGCVGFVAFYFVIDYTTRINTKTSIRIDDDRVILKNHKGDEVRSALTKVFYTDTIVFADTITVFLGQPQAPIYDKERTLGELAARLPATQRISALQMQKMMLAARHPTSIIAILALIALTVAAAFVYLES